MPFKGTVADTKLSCAQCMYLSEMKRFVLYAHVCGFSNENGKGCVHIQQIDATILQTTIYKKCLYVYVLGDMRSAFVLSFNLLCKSFILTSLFVRSFAFRIQVHALN